MTTWVSLVVEDVLSEAVANTLLQQVNQKYNRDYEVGVCFDKRGSDYIFKRINGFNKSSKGGIFFVLSDQDTPKNCPPKIIGEKIEGSIHPNLIWRFAVMEIESWVMAHADAFKKFLEVHSNQPLLAGFSNTDEIPNPKEFLIRLAKRSRSRRIREDLVPRPGSTSRIGPDYNGRLTEFVYEKWKAEIASCHSLSLRRAIRNLSGHCPEV